MAPPETQTGAEDVQYLSIKEMRTKLSRSTNSIYDLIKQGVLPKPAKLGGENVWREDMVDAAISNLANEQGLNWSAPVAPPAPAPRAV